MHESTPTDPVITARTVPLRPASPAAAPPVHDDPPPPRPEGLYPLPTTMADALHDWRVIQSGDRPPGPHRAYLRHLVAQALADGLFYAVDVRTRVISELGDLLTDELRTRNDARARTEGGVIGMEIFLAREALRLDAERREADAAHGRVQPRVGLHLGTLIWHDHKRTLACQVTAVDGQSVTLTGRRGRREVTVRADAQYIERAIARTRARAESKRAAP